MRVRQVDCMSPLLLSFMIVAFAETLDISCKQLGHKMMIFSTCTNSPRDRGSLTRNAPKTFSEGTLLEFLNVLYVENRDFPFEDWNQLAKGMQLIYDHLKRFVLEMHIGKGAKPSKMECVFFPPLGSFNRIQT